MQRLSAWARWIGAGVFTIFVIPIAVEFVKHVAESIGLYDRPREAAGTILNFFLSLAELPWLGVTALVLAGFVAGLWLDWLLRRLDRSRAEERKALGTEMVNRLGDLKYPMSQTRPQIMSCFTAARKLGIWAPDQRAFATHPVRAKNLITDYLMHVGTMLRDGHFREAKQHAKNSKAAFASAYVDFGLYRT